MNNNIIILLNILKYIENEAVDRFGSLFTASFSDHA